MDAPVQPSCAIIGLPVQGTTARCLGHASNITIRDGDPRLLGSQDTLECRDLGLFYTTDGKLWRARWSQWQEDAAGPVSGTLAYTAAREA